MFSLSDLNIMFSLAHMTLSNLFMGTQACKGNKLIGFWLEENENIYFAMFDTSLRIVLFLYLDNFF